jgi:hypothetical protein
MNFLYLRSVHQDGAMNLNETVGPELLSDGADRSSDQVRSGR